MKSIRQFVNYLNEGKIPPVDFFIESAYTDVKGETRPRYLVTKRTVSASTKKEGCPALGDSPLFISACTRSGSGRISSRSRSLLLDGVELVLQVFRSFSPDAFGDVEVFKKKFVLFLRVASGVLEDLPDFQRGLDRGA